MAPCHRNHGNEERARWRHKCRVRLSTHLYEHLGISVDPANIRLKTGPNDPYRWIPLPSKKHLLDKQLSKGCLRDYKEIYASVGIALEAVPADALTGDDHISGETIVALHSVPELERKEPQGKQPEHQESFASRVIQLTAENDALRIIRQELESRAHKGEAAVHDLQGQLRDSQAMVKRLEIEGFKLQENYHKAVAMEETFRKAAQDSEQALRAIIGGVEAAKNQVPSFLQSRLDQSHTST